MFRILFPGSGVSDPALGGSGAVFGILRCQAWPASRAPPLMPAQRESPSAPGSVLCAPSMAPSAPEKCVLTTPVTAGFSLGCRIREAWAGTGGGKEGRSQVFPLSFLCPSPRHQLHLLRAPSEPRWTLPPWSSALPGPLHGPTSHGWF